MTTQTELVGEVNGRVSTRNGVARLAPRAAAF